MPNAWSLRSAMLAGRDVADTGLSITSDTRDLVLTFTDKSTALRGKVTARQGSIESAYLMVFPSDEKLWMDYGFGRRMRVMRLAADGAFTINGLPEGDYLLVSFRSSATDREVRNPAFLRALRSSARRVSLREGSRPFAGEAADERNDAAARPEPRRDRLGRSGVDRRIGQHGVDEGRHVPEAVEHPRQELLLLGRRSLADRAHERVGRRRGRRQR